MDALLAGIAEKLCDDAGLPRPGWARRVPGVAMPWISPGTPRMQAAAGAGTPPQLAARNIFVRADSLWRGVAAVGDHDVAVWSDRSRNDARMSVTFRGVKHFWSIRYRFSTTR